MESHSGTEQRDQLVLDHLFLVRAIAARYRPALPPQVEFGDLAQAGVIGLIEAAGKYRPDAEVSFSNYAKHRIKGAILDSLRRLDCAPRHLRRAYKSMDAAVDELTGQLQRCPTEMELAGKLGMSVGELRTMMLDIYNAAQITGASATTGEAHLDWAGSSEGPDSISEREEREQMLRRMLDRLPVVHRQVTLLRYVDEMPMNKIGQVLGMSEGQAYRIHKQALERLATLLEGAGLGARVAVGNNGIARAAVSAM